MREGALRAGQVPLYSWQTIVSGRRALIGAHTIASADGGRSEERDSSRLAFASQNHSARFITTCPGVFPTRTTGPLAVMKVLRIDAALGESLENRGLGDELHSGSLRGLGSLVTALDVMHFFNFFLPLCRESYVFYVQEL